MNKIFIDDELTKRLNIKYDDREYAKEAGAIWNPHIKKWTTHMDISDFFKKMNKIKRDGLSEFFEVTLKENMWHYARMLGAENTIFCNNPYRFTVFGKKNIFFKKMKEMKEKNDIENKKKWDKLERYDNEYYFKKEIEEYEQIIKKENEADEHLYNDIKFMINYMKI